MAEEMESELGPQSKGLLEKLSDKLHESKEATEELGAPLAAITTAVDMSGIAVAAAATTGLKAVTSGLSIGFDLIKATNTAGWKGIAGSMDLFGKGLDKIGFGIFRLTKIQETAAIIAERGRKMAKAVGDTMTSGITTAAKKVGGIAKGILDILLEGAFLVGLWMLMKWLEGPGFKWVMKIYDYVEKVGEWISLLFTDPSQALTDLWNGMLSGAADIGNWIWDNAFAPLWTWFEDMFPGTASTLKKLWDGVSTLAGNLGDWLYEKALKPLWDWIKLLFSDPKAALDQAWGAMVKLGDWVYNNAIKPVWDWINLLFDDPKAALVEALKGITTLGKWLWDNAIKPLWTWFETTFPDASAWLKEQWATFMSTGFGKWLYDTLLEPFSKWLELAFTDPSAALDEAWIFFKKMGTWLYERMLLPFWNWLKKLFTDPTAALTEAFTFFTSIADWIYTNALEPFWKWFKGLFPDVAKALETFWADLTAPEGEEKKQGGVIGAIMGLLRGIWRWFSNLLDFSSMEGLVSTAINVFFLPWNIIGTLIGKMWNFIKGWFGFKEGEAEVDEEFNLGKLITSIIGKIADFFRGLFNIDIASIGRAILGDTLYNLMFATEEEKAIMAKKKEIEDLLEDVGEEKWHETKGEIAKDKENLRKAQEELAKMEADLLSTKNAAAGVPPVNPALEGGAGGTGGNVTIIDQSTVVGGTQNNSQPVSIGMGLPTAPPGRLVTE